MDKNAIYLKPIKNIFFFIPDKKFLSYFFLELYFLESFLIVYDLFIQSEKY